MTSFNTRVLFVWLVSVIAITLVPFNFGVPPLVQEHGLKVFQYGSFERDPIHFMLNLLLFVPFGALLHQEGRYRSVRLRSVMILAGMCGVLISGIVEYLQAFLPTRDSSLIDVFANASGALMGVAAARSWGAPVEARVHRLRARTSLAMLSGLIVGFLVVALLISGALQTRTRLSNWNPEYALLIGNERTGDRPWRGRVFALAMTDASTPLASMRGFSAGESMALPGAEIATFDFKGSSPYRDAAGNLPALEWTERQNTSGDSGVELPGHSWLQTDGSASRLANRLRQTNAFTLRVQCATDDALQYGPAPIVTNGNFTLGQQGVDLVFRLRTPATGVNGSRLEVLVPGTFSDRHPREILVTFDGATLLVAIAHGDVSRTELTPGASVALAIPSLSVQPHELQMYKVAYVAVLSLVPGVLVGLLGHTSHDRQLFGVGWVLAFAVLLEATLVGVSGRAFDWGNAAVTAGVAAVVFTVSGGTLSLPTLAPELCGRPDPRRNASDGPWNHAT